MESTQLIDSPASYNVDNMTFSKIQIQKIGETGMTSKRINIGTKNADGSFGELVISTPLLFSFGVSENLDQASRALNGYTMPLCLHNKDGPTEDELAFSNTFNKIVEKCKDFLITNKKELKMADLERSDLRKLNPIYVKKDADGNVVEGSSPTLYAKLIVSKKNNTTKILTEFFDASTGIQYNALDLIGKYCYTRAVVKVESLFLGSLKVSLQIKLYEAEISLVNSGVKRLLSRPAGGVSPPVPGKVTPASSTNPLGNEDDDDDVGSITGDDITDSLHHPIVMEEQAPSTKVKMFKKKVPKKE